MRLSSVRITALLLALAACATPSQPGGAGAPATAIQVQTNRQFEIAVGQEARLEGTSIVLRFGGVANDSRCPSDVQCVWAGNALVVLSLRQGEGPATDASLNTTLDPKITKFGGYSIKLVDLKPVPNTGKAIAAGEYVATLEVNPG